MSELSANNKRLAKNAAFMYIRMIIVMLIALYTTRVILNVLGVEDYGVYNVVAGFVSLFTVFNSCLTTGTNRFYNYALGKQDSDEVSDVYKSSLLIQVIIIVIALCLVESFGLWYLNTKMNIAESRMVVANYLFQFSVMSLVMLVLQTPYSAAVLAHERMDFYATVSIIDAFLKLAIVFVISSFGEDKLLIYGVLLMAISVVNFMLYYGYCKKNFKALNLKRPLNRRLFKSLLSFSGWSTLDPLSYMVRDQGSNLVLNSFFGTIVNAAYGIAVQVSGAISSFASNLSVAFRPQIIQSYSSGDHQRAKTLMMSMSKINFILQSLIAIPIIFELPHLLEVWLGPRYPEYTVTFSTLVIMISTVNTLNEPVSIIMVSTGRIKKVKTISMLLICSVVPVGYVLLYLGFPPYSIYIVMIILTILNQISCVLIMASEFKALSVSEYITHVAIPCFLFAVTSTVIPAIITWLMPQTFVRLMIVFALSMVSSACIAYYIVFDKTEKGYVKSIIRKFNKFI